MTKNKFLQYDGNDRGQTETGKAVSTNSLIKNNGRKYVGETEIRKEMKELNFGKGKEYLFPQYRKKGRSEVGKYIRRIALTSTLKKKKRVMRLSTRREMERVH